MYHGHSEKGPRSTPGATRVRELRLHEAENTAGPCSPSVAPNVPPVVAGAKPVTVEHIKIHGKSMEGNLEGDSVDRDLFMFLPPSYFKEASRRFPVVCALHGYSIGAEQWTHEIHAPQTIEGAFAQDAKNMIVVTARLEDSTQRLDVFKFGHYRRF
jgi:hypothetical protein